MFQGGGGPFKWSAPCLGLVAARIPETGVPILIIDGSKRRKWTSKNEIVKELDGGSLGAIRGARGTFHRIESSPRRSFSETNVDSREGIGIFVLILGLPEAKKQHANYRA